VDDIAIEFLNPEAQQRETDQADRPGFGKSMREVKDYLFSSQLSRNLKGTI
jgi:hypothetical protein